MTATLKKLIQELPKESLTMIRGNSLVLRNGDVHYPFRQDSDFLYLTGLSVPGLVLTICDEEVLLWREPIEEKDIIWWSDKLTDDEMQGISGIKDIRDIGKLEEYCICHRDMAPCSVIAKNEAILSEEKENKTASYLAVTETSKTELWQSIVHEMRTIKSHEEIAKIQNCIRITESIYEEILEKIQPWMYEYEIEALIAHGFRRHNGTEAFPTIVASGVNSCTLHYTKNNRQIESGDIVLIDFGIELWWYGSDISRTFAVWWLSQKQQAIYDAVEDVKRFAEDTLKPGITRRAWNLGVKEYMYNTCTRLGLKDIEKYTPVTNPYYPHSIGHFLGLDTHDVGDSDVPLKPWMVLTIEPWIYVREESIWIRIEDDYLVTESGCVKLS